MIIFKHEKPFDTSELKANVLRDHRQVGDLTYDLSRRHAQHFGGNSINDFFNGMEYWHRMGAMDQADFRRVMALFPEKEMKFVAMMPPHVVAMLQETNPEILKDRTEFYRFLAQHPEYQVAG